MAKCSNNTVYMPVSSLTDVFLCGNFSINDSCSTKKKVKLGVVAHAHNPSI